MTEAFVRKITKLSRWITHYDEVYLHKALRYRSPRESSPLTKASNHLRSFASYNILTTTRIA